MTPKPSEVLRRLRRAVVGQEEGCRAIVEALLLSHSAAAARLGGGGDGLPPIIATLIIGSTASGKTFIVRSLLDILDIPTVFIDCTGITGAGWRGASLSDWLLPAAQLQAENPGRPVAIMLDEFDKIVRGNGESDGFDIGPELLGLFSGGTVSLHPEESKTPATLDADGLVIVAMGAFTGIDAIVRDRIRAEAGSPVGFTGKLAETLGETGAYPRVTARDLQEWGIMRELTGRMGAIIALPPLTADDLSAIAREHAISPYERILPGKSPLKMSEEAARWLGREAARSGLGARAVNNEVRALAARANADMLEDDSIVSAKVVCADGKLGLEYGHGTRQAAERPPNPARDDRQKRLDALVSDLMFPDSGRSGNPGGEVPDLPALMDSLVPPERFAALASLEHADALCDAVLRYGLPGEDKHRLLKALILYVSVYYKSQPDYRRMREVLRLLALARRDDPAQARSPLDVVIEGYHGDGGSFRGFSEWLEDSARTRGEVAAGAVCLSEYRRFARLDALRQNAVALAVARSAARAVLDERREGSLLAVIGGGS